MKRQWPMVVAIVAGIALLGWGLTRFAPAPEGATVGSTAPDYRVLDLATGDSIGIRSHYDGQVTLLNIWATWCLPCRAEMPAMERVYRDYRDRGFRIAAVSVDEGNDGRIERFAQELGLTFDLLHDRSALIQQAYQTLGVPQSFLIDRSGTITFVTLGEEDWDTPELRERIEALLE